MAYEKPTSPTDQDEELRGLEGKQKADRGYAIELKKAKTLGNLKANVSSKLKAAMADDAEAQARVAELEQGVGKVVAAGSSDITIDQSLTGTGVLGYNKGLSAETAISTDPLSAEAITEDTRNAEIVAAHERSTELGHAGQSDNVRTLVDASGNKVAVALTLEGNVENKTEEKYGSREGQPDAVYGEGQRFVESAGAGEINSYVRKGGSMEGDHIGMQAHILERSTMPTAEMQHKLHQAGYVKAEVAEIVQRVRGRTAAMDHVQAAERQTAMAA